MGGATAYFSQYFSDRRSFVRRFVNGFSLAALTPIPQMLLHRQSTAPEESWLEGLNGKHRQFFDVKVMNGATPLNRVSSFIDVYRDVYGLGEHDVNAVFGAHGEGLGYVLGDKAWSKYELGARFQVCEPGSTSRAQRNIFARAERGVLPPEDHSIARLQLRGVRFLACARAIRNLAATLAGDGFGTVETIRDDLTRGVLVGVTVVPAMIVAVNRAQETGLSYAYVA